MELWRFGQAIEALGPQDRYLLKEPLGSGGMADVCLAWDKREQRQVAIKVLKEEDSQDQEALDRFAAEVEQMTQLQHPHILHIYSGLRPKVLAGATIHYTVMEYARGRDLHKLLRKGVPYDFERTFTIFAQIGAAVQYAHDQGVIHRDIKPQNILLRNPVNEPLHALLCDFGMVVEINATHYTYPGGGTPSYMAPEQADGHPQKASDIFSLGVLLYQLCTGTLPYQHSHYDKAWHSTPEAAPAPPSTLNPRIPPALDAVILSALAHDPAQRPASAAAFVQRVQQASRPAPPATNSQPSLWSGAPNPQRGTPTAHMPAPPDDDSGVVSPAATNPMTVLPPAPDSEPGVISLYSSRSLRKPTPNPPPHTQTGLNSIVPPRASISPVRAVPPIVPPRPPAPATPARTAQNRLRGRRLPLAVLLICTILLIGGIVLTTLALNTHTPPSGPFAFTVSITPDVQQITNSYAISAVTGTPDATTLQVQARILTADAQPTSQTVNATGQAQTAAKYATGFLTFYNSNTTAMAIARTVITSSNGVQIENDTTVTIPAGSPASPNFQTVAATALQPGASGNIDAAAIDGGCCASGIAVKNLSAFTGGQDPQNYTVVRQSDIDGVTDSIMPRQVTQAQAALSAKLGKSEHYAENGTCTPTDSANHNAGDKASTVTVQISVHCTREVYDTSQIAAVVTGQMAKTVQNATGTHFSSYSLLDGQGKTTTLATVLSVAQTGFDPQTGTVSLGVQASGTWVYVFSTAEQQHIKSLIAGKTVAQAITILQGQPGVVKVVIEPTTGSLPSDTGQIGIAPVNVRGVSAPGGGAGSGGGAASGTPVTTSPTIGPLPTGTGVGMG